MHISCLYLSFVKCLFVFFAHLSVCLIYKSFRHVLIQYYRNNIKRGAWDLSSPARNGTLCPLHCECRVNHWTTRKVPDLKKSLYNFQMLLSFYSYCKILALFPMLCNASLQPVYTQQFMPPTPPPPKHFGQIHFGHTKVINFLSNTVKYPTQCSKFSFKLKETYLSCSHYLLE